jgi:hypothetical protein
MMNKQRPEKIRSSDLFFETYPRWKRIRLTLVEIVVVLAYLIGFCYALHLTEAIG